MIIQFPYLLYCRRTYLSYRLILYLLLKAELQKVSFILYPLLFLAQVISVEFSRAILLVKEADYVNT